jgi:2-keto-4-pentenoate hydratase
LTPDQIRQAAEMLAQARRSRTLLEDIPADIQPQHVEDAYAIQYAIANLLGPIGGWKVGLPKPGAAPRATPIPARYAIASGGRWPTTTPTRIEVEFAVRIGTSLPQRSEPYTHEEVLNAIGSAHIAFEILGARFQDRTRIAPLTLLADGQSNSGLVTGAPIPNWRQLGLDRLEMTLRVNATTEAAVSAGSALEPTLDALTWLANHAAEHVGGLQKGQVILTGARIGPVTVPAQSSVEAHTGDARVSATFG